MVRRRATRSSPVRSSKRRAPRVSSRCSTDRGRLAVPRNIEVKVRVSDLARARTAALAAGARSRGIEAQTDRYYELDGGRRVKLRVRDGGPAELIRYERPETAGVRA